MRFNLPVLRLLSWRTKIRPVSHAERRQPLLETLESRSLLATIVVNSPDDSVLADEFLTLREAIVAANATTEADTINFAATLTNQTITLSLGELTVSNSLTIQGLGADKLAISGGSGATQSRVLNLSGGGTNRYNISDITIKDGNGVGTSPGFGGAVRFVGAQNHLTMTNSVIRDSSALTGGSDGGGLFADSGTIDLKNVTVMNNTAVFGGGLGFLEVNGSLTNVTISGNTATTRAGGLLNFASRASATSSLRLINSTVANNASAISAGIRNTVQNDGLASTIMLGNTIVANNTGGGAQFSNTGAGATTVSLGHNLASDASGALIQTGDKQNTDPHLGPLTSNGGGTLTHALLSGSPALEAGDNALSKEAGPNGIFGDGDDLPLTTDQRGQPRLVGKLVDIGAFEKPHLWHNQVRAFDVTGPAFIQDGLVTALDALTIINFINAFLPGPVPDSATAGPPFYDTNDDDWVTAADALDIINYINAFGPDQANTGGEGESRVAAPPAVALLDLLAADSATQPKRRL
jgi:hypothetical protein